MNATPPDEPTRDERLRAALRHAPDSDARPPEALSAQILRSAQRATAQVESPTARLWRAMQTGLTALTRPAPAAAFATLALATVIGVMWQDGPPPEERAAPAPAAPRVLESPSPAKPADPAPAAAPPAPAERGGEASRRVERPAPPSAPKRAAPAATAEIARDTATQNAAPAAKAAADAAGAGAPAEAAPPAAAPAPQPAKEAEIDAMRERRAMAPAAVTGRPEDARSSMARAPLAGAAAPDPLAALAQGWPGASDTQRVALDELRRLSAGRWTRVTPSPDAWTHSGGFADAAAQPLGRLTITDDAVFWRPEGPDDRAWRAPLPPGVAADLRQRLGLGSLR